MAASLEGLGVVVTRPERQAASLCALLEAAGAHTLRLPVIDILPCEADDAAQSASIPADILLFTSANAVRHGGGQLRRYAHAILGAIGPATALALQAEGRPAGFVSGGSIDSEGLLAHPQLSHLDGRRILIVTGRDGRKVLQQELSRRGAQVSVAEVYERRPAAIDAGLRQTVLVGIQQDQLHLITATSVDIAARLLTLDELRAELERVHWLLPSERAAAAVRALGLRAPVITAASAQDHSLLEAVLRWRGGAPGGSVA